MQTSGRLQEEVTKPLNTGIVQDSVLIIEDNPNDLELLSVLLKGTFRIHTATDGATGFEKALKHKPTCIISDIRMPQMSGFTLLKKIRSCEEIAQTPLVLLSALDDIPSRVQG